MILTDLMLISNVLISDNFISFHIICLAKFYMFSKETLVKKYRYQNSLTN